MFSVPVKQIPLSMASTSQYNNMGSPLHRPDFSGSLLSALTELIRKMLPVVDLDWRLFFSSFFFSFELWNWRVVGCETLCKKGQNAGWVFLVGSRDFVMECCAYWSLHSDFSTTCDGAVKRKVLKTFPHRSGFNQNDLVDWRDRCETGRDENAYCWRLRRRGGGTVEWSEGERLA